MQDHVVELFAEFCSVAERAVSEHADGELFDELLPRLRECPQPRRVDTSGHPVVDRWLDRAVDAASPNWSNLARSLLGATTDLPWMTSYQNLEPSDALAQFQPHYTYQLLVGPSRFGHTPPFAHDEIIAGFTLQAPNITYPAHHHAPPEMYGVISGTLDWQVGSEWTRRQPGDVIVHRPHESHSMRTGDLPALCWVAWPRDAHSHVYMPSLDPPHERMDPIAY